MNFYMIFTYIAHFARSTRDSGPLAQEPRRAACNNSRRGIRRAPARKTNERKHDSGHKIGSPVKNVRVNFSFPSIPLRKPISKVVVCALLHKV